VGAELQLRQFRRLLYVALTDANVEHPGLGAEVEPHEGSPPLGLLCYGLVTGSLAA
jgi:hypothetical protein